MKNKRLTRMLTLSCVMMLLVCCMAVPAFATSGNVSGAITDTWNAAQGQIKDIVNNVVFPVIDMILAVLLFVKIATAYMDYRKHGSSSLLRLRSCSPACCSASPLPATSGTFSKQ